MEVTVLGAAGTVTGSKYLVTTGTTRVLVDCGMYQGLKELRLRNWEAPPFDPREIDAVVLTHAHLDHCGYLPLVVRRGFSGPVYGTPATRGLARIILSDAAHLQEEDAKRANRYGYSRHDPALPLYTARDVERTLPLFRTVDFDETFRVGDLTISLIPAGHIIGAASVRVEHEGRVAFFSGDVGRPVDLLMRPPRRFGGADLLVVESTYGDRLHSDQDPHAELAQVVNQVCGRGGVLMIPAFAVGRSQALLHVLAELTARGEIPPVPTYLDSPMAIDATDLFCSHSGEHRLADAQVEAMCRNAEFTRSPEESRRIDQRGGPAIVIAGSGMATGGRILHHLKRFAPDPRHGILLVGFQAAGTRGAALRRGAESVRIHGQEVPVRAERFTMDSLSGHADWRELLDWLGEAPEPARTLITHGEPEAAAAFRVHLRDELGWTATVARQNQTVRV